MKWALYNVLFALAYPFLLPGFLLRMVRRGGYAARMNDRFAIYPEEVVKRFRAGERPVWVHAVSVGEVQVAGQLMREWRRVEPTVRFCLSTTSSTGWKTAEKVLGEGDELIYNPLDFPNFVKSALKTVRPRAVVLVESELWPNFIRRAAREGIPVFLVNARVSDRSAPRYRAARFFFADVLGAFSRIFAQSEVDAGRLKAAMRESDHGKVVVTGSFKFDTASRNPEKERVMAEWAGEGKPILLGASTWPGEDEVLLRIYAKTKDKARLVIAPRHFEKADAVEANILKAGFTCRRRSRGDSEGEVLLADTTGELMGLCGIAGMVFVGKSLCAHGGQNMIEPCLCGKPVFVGPNTENFRPVMRDLLAADAISVANDAEELERKICAAVDDPAAAAELGRRAAEAVMSRKGVVPKCVDSMRSVVG